MGAHEIPTMISGGEAHVHIFMRRRYFEKTGVPLGVSCDCDMAEQMVLSPPMRTTIDKAGRLVIPKELRQEGGLKPGTELEIRWRHGVMEIEPAAIPVKLKKRGRFLVAVPDHPVEPLTSESVERTRRQIHRNRSASS
jgi:AbrB family looped-hinge helix DNA binding protein